MKLSQETTIIAPEKLRDYVVNLSHPDGESKARFLRVMGYEQKNWKTLEIDLRTQHLSQEVIPGQKSDYEKNRSPCPPYRPQWKNAMAQMSLDDSEGGNPSPALSPLFRRKNHDSSFVFQSDPDTRYPDSQFSRWRHGPTMMLSIILPPTSIPKDMRWSVLPATVKQLPWYRFLPRHCARRRAKM